MAKQLTKAEEQIMQVIWKLDKAFLREIIDALPNPKPHNNTVATIVKILVEKEFLGVTLFGRMHQYYPLLSKEAYSKASMKGLIKGYFEGSFSNAVSFYGKGKQPERGRIGTAVKAIKKEGLVAQSSYPFRSSTF